jgi:2,3-bisphosphoglycerate-independent phosphoglycerate mutase
VHAHTDHLKAICDLCKKQELNRVYLHLFTDGRDTDPKSGKAFITDLEAYLKHSTGEIASISGRYYAMDRDKRWERIQLAYNCLVKGEGQIAKDALTAIENAYHSGTTDEFILPTNIISNSGAPKATIQEGDAVICFNFRTDRCREITSVLTQKDFPEFGMKKLALTFTTMTQYDQTFQRVNVIFENDNLNNTLGEVLSDNGKRQIRIAETEKYPHVTFFFNGGREDPFPGENRIMVASPKVATYDLQPEMSALEITDQLIPEIEKKSADFICLNYANADMVGHTGVFSAAIRAVETVDACVKRVVTAALDQDYTILVTADHGNADYMINEDGSPNTAHTLNPVPLIFVDKNYRGKLQTGKLGDLAPTILRWMQLPVPSEMSGKCLISQ